jgi:hypothetical protein
MSLTAEQKKAGRVFRDACQDELNALNAREPAGGTAHPLHRVERHPCKARGGASAGLALREHYRAGADGLLCFIWKDGRCPDCGLVLRSAAGIIDLAARRPPERT